MPQGKFCFADTVPAAPKQAKLLDPWRNYAGDFVNEDVFLETVYNSLTGQKTGQFVQHN